MKPRPGQIALEEIHQPRRAFIRQRLDECRIHKRKDRHAGANAQCHDKNRGGRKAGILEQLPDCKPRVAHQVLQPLRPAAEIEPLAGHAHAAEFALRLLQRRVLAHALALQRLRFELKMRLNLLGEIFPATLALSHSQASSGFCTVPSPRINPMARVNRCHSLVFSISCARPFGISE